MKKDYSGIALILFFVCLVLVLLLIDANRKTIKYDDLVEISETLDEDAMYDIISDIEELKDYIYDSKANSEDYKEHIWYALVDISDKCEDVDNSVYSVICELDHYISKYEDD